jgi:hypothetical protein
MHKLIKNVNGKKYIINVIDHNDFCGGPDVGGGGGDVAIASVTGSSTGSMESIPMVWDSISAVWEIIHP